MIVDIKKIESQIRKIAKTGSLGVGLSSHCKKESMPKRNVDFQDILNVLNWGKVTHNPDKKTKMKFKVSGADIEGVPLCVIVIIVDEDSLFVKTVHDV